MNERTTERVRSSKTRSLCSFIRPFIQFVPSFVRSSVFVRSFLPSFLRSFPPSFVRWMVPWFVPSFVGWFVVGSFACSLVCSFVVSSLRCIAFFQSLSSGLVWCRGAIFLVEVHECWLQHSTSVLPHKLFHYNSMPTHMALPVLLLRGRLFH